MAVTRRLSRFGDWSTLRPMCHSGSLRDQQPFFAGADVGSRMDQVRRAINDIRVHWDRYPDFVADLREYLERQAARAGTGGSDGEDGEGGEEDGQRVAALFSGVKEWADRRDPGEDDGDGDDYSAIRLYTSQPGYRRIFGTINAAFRDAGLTRDTKALRSAAFLVELLSIDLFNYRHRHTHADNFEGVVHRGMCVSDAQLGRFAELASGPVDQRYLSIPLAMASASTDRASALAFALEQARRHPGRHPLLWEIRVAGLPAELLDVYRAAFPRGTVTSMCAVPIDRLSDYPYEKEVLLRGPFFQILRLTRNTAGRGGRDEPTHVVEAVMLNSNRDHVSTVASDEGEDRRARDLFRTLVTLHRSALCAQYAGERGLAGDAAVYRSLHSGSRAALDRHLERPGGASR
ncbi:hypothetical protein CUT44_18145 [Streptomyces carminius]|uniref:Uncharacterized protein n=1 Tax=Streptomyces carminius TaxID=2665496 RepID=A0A2M8LWX3_9ACTN|nr:hypothetical protein [Streptomyces carminius]PJE96425.1 hypothetical protein CUT44_18145 [Streptomyces carminius]